MITIGTRGSKLALYQANKLKDILTEKYSDKEFEIRVIVTKGDKIQDVPLSKIGDKGLFTKELEKELIAGGIDMAVHSLKDLPTIFPEGTMLGGVLERAESLDALISKNGKTLDQLTSKDKIATSSLRRKSSLLAYNPDYQIIDIRGNVDTRLRKMDEGHCDAMVMAAAGLQRVGYGNRITQIVDTEIIIPAPGQGAIAIEIRDNDSTIKQLIDGINHHDTFITTQAERRFLRLLEGGCQIPIGCHAILKNDTLQLTGFLSDLDGKEIFIETVTGLKNNGLQLAEELADIVLSKGGRAILDEIFRTFRS
ncbi:MAG: hydroxymethylbilane synthase [Bacteroidales bacterium]|jgi:hydroxymethylbilane synthase|nr:hydroxymethylbilane synthase [Bacteroidales bacterium]